MEAEGIKIEESLLAILESVSLDEIKKLKDNPKVGQWIKRPWYNGKHYQRESFRSAAESAKDLHGNVEIPNRREVFYISQKSRFGLDNVEVAYFANNIVLSTYETTPSFRNQDDLTWEKNTQVYWEGKSDPHPNSTKHDVKCKITPDTILLDLTRGGFLVRLIEKSYPNFFEEVILNKHEAVYLQSCTLASWSYNQGFDGIIYHSVRNTTDIQCCGKCLVMFNKNKVIRNDGRHL